MSVYDKVPDPSLIDLTPDREVERPVRYLNLLNQTLDCSRTSLFTLNGNRQALKPTITTGTTPTFEFTESSWNELYQKRASQAHPVAQGDIISYGVLCPYLIQPGQLPSLLVFEFKTERDANSKLEPCTLGANEFWHTLQYSELNRRIRCITAINNCQNFFPEVKKTICHVCESLQEYFGAPGVTISLIRSRDNHKITFDKYFFHNKLHSFETFTTTLGLSHYCATRNKPFIVYETKMDDGPFRGKIKEFEFDNVSVASGSSLEIQFIRTIKTVDDEQSLMLVPLRATGSNDIIGILKVGDFETPERFDEFNLTALVSLGTSVSLLLNMLDISRTAYNIGFSLSTQKEFLSGLEAILMYKEISLGLFHQVSNHLNVIDNKLQEAHIVEHAIFTSSDQLKDFFLLAKEAITNAKRLIQRAQKRGRKTSPQQSKCRLIEDTLLDALDTTARSIKNTSIRIEKSLGSSDFEIIADPDFLSESFINIVNNSISAVKQNTTQGDKRISVFVRERNNLIEIRFKDNGVGLKPNTQDKVFDPYFTTKGVKGTGLGLFFARKVIEQCGGTIDFERSFPLKGSILRVTLPYEQRVARTR